MNINHEWSSLKPVKAGMLRYIASDGSVHDCMEGAWDYVLDADSSAIVIARGPVEWLEFIKEQKLIEAKWSLRQCYTGEDADFLRDCGIAWNGPLHLWTLKVVQDEVQ